MKRTSLLMLSLLLVIAMVLVSCGKTDTDTSATDSAETSTQDNSKVEEVMKNFATSVSGTTVSLTYTVDYTVDVDANGGTGNMDSFKRKINSVSVVTMDLGDDLYIKVSKTSKDLLNETETVEEKLLYKAEDGKYYYTTTSLPAEEVAASDAKAKVEAIFAEALEEQVATVSLDMLVYNSTSKEYEQKFFGFTDTFEAADLADPTYAVNSKNGVTVTYKPEYIGYHTDGGWSDFTNAKDGFAATITIETNEKGYVESIDEKYNDVALEFNIMNPPPIVSIAGSRKLTAEYGKEISKETDVAHEDSTVSIKVTAGGTATVTTCAMGDFANMTPHNDGDAVEPGKILCVMPAAEEGKEVAFVKVNGSVETMLPPAQAGGWYCFPVIAGENTVEVIFRTEGESKLATVVFEDAENGTFTVSYLDFAQGGPAAPQTPVASGDIVDMAAGQMWLVFTATPADGYTLDKITVNGEEAANYGAILFALNGETDTEYTVVVTFKAN